MRHQPTSLRTCLPKKGALRVPFSSVWRSPFVIVIPRQALAAFTNAFLYFMSENTIECFPGGLSFHPGKDSFPLSTDTMALADFVQLRPGSRVVDLGSGSGALGLLLCGTYPDCTVTGIELHEPSHKAALDNIARNHLECRMQSLLGDIREVRKLLPANSYQCVVSNPPYFSSGAASRSHATARQELTCSLEDIFAAAKWLLPTGGDLFLVHKPERLADIFVFARQYALETKVLQPLCHKPGDAPAVMLVQCRRGGRPGLRFLPPICLYNMDGTYSQHYRRIYHID